MPLTSLAISCIAMAVWWVAGRIERQYWPHSPPQQLRRGMEMGRTSAWDMDGSAGGVLVFHGGP